MLESNSFVVRERALRATWRRTYDIHDGETGELLGTASQSSRWVWAPLGLVLGRRSVPVRTEVRERTDDSLVFALERNGVFTSGIEVLDSQGDPVGTFLTRSFSLRSGFSIFDRNGNRFAEVRGLFLTAEYAIVTPDGKAELGRVTRQWGGLAKALFTTASTYGVRVDPDLAEQPLAKMLILGAALAVDDLVGRTG